MGKKAVLVGCNYPGTKAELKGCINDVRRIHRCVVEHYTASKSLISLCSLTLMSHTSSPPAETSVKRSPISLRAHGQGMHCSFTTVGMVPARLLVETGEDDDTGYDEYCIVPCDINLITDDDFRDFVDRKPEGCRVGLLPHCGLVDEAKEQISESTKRRDSEESGSSGFGFKSFL